MSQSADHKNKNNDKNIDLRSNDNDFSAQHTSRIFTWNFNSFFTCFVRPRHVDDSGIEFPGYKEHRLNLKNQEDLKALVWSYGGPRPSLIKSVEVIVDKEAFTVKVHWKIYDKTE